ncbi:TPA: hypothetical protein H1005_02780 [archaeon]|uniref:AN1-type domain-containing protein n=1 Tax=Candidatus Naiadarchaeum limnaeum TaxID=2756139 RepID=A0A832V2J1_9ARCH|nr:hypothetical protein [Candidatus Naiadarchaeales archaeon SRR2090153.bin1042]HIK00821.1 hypothetical protein [Candidatus Naiadarchaeum limnaeum]
MDTCAIEACGQDAVDECEVCGMTFCRKHGKKEEHICFDCKAKEENTGDDVELF